MPLHRNDDGSLGPCSRDRLHLRRGSAAQTSPHGASAAAASASRNPSRAVAAVTPALTADTTFTSALSTSSPKPADSRLLDPVARANLASPGHGHGEPDQVLLALGEQRCAVGLRRYPTTSVSSYGMSELLGIQGTIKYPVCNISGRKIAMHSRRDRPRVGACETRPRRAARPSLPRLVRDLRARSVRLYRRGRREVP